jgi:single-strand DNA-binding protein
MNRVILLGNLTRDIEVRYGNSGLAIGKSGIATNRRVKTQSGEQRDETMFVDITIFGGAAETVAKYFRKGSKILIEGRLQLERWTDQNGMNRSKHSVTVDNFHFVESKSDSNSGGNWNNNQNQQQNGGGWENNNNQNSGWGGNQQQQSSGWGGNQQQNQNFSQNSSRNQPKNGGNSNPPQGKDQKSGSDIPEIDIDSDMDDQVPF